MEDYVGKLVRPIAGHDKGTLCYVTAVEAPYLFLADGKRRRLAKPKRKKLCHVEVVGCEAPKEGDGHPMSDRELRRWLAISRDKLRADQGGN